MKIKIIIIILIICSNVYGLELNNQIFIQFFKIYPNQSSLNENFRLKRAQIKLNKKINNYISIEFAPDFQSVSNSQIKPYLKSAFVSFNHYNKIIYTFGYQFSSIYGPLRMNWRNPFIDGVAGVVNDFHEVADFGLSFKWNIKNDIIFKSGIFNGTGYKTNENDKNKKIEFIIFKGDEILKDESNNYGTIFSLEPYENNESKMFFDYRYGLFFGKFKNLNRVGIEYHHKSNNENHIKNDLITIFSTNKINKKINLVNKFELLRKSSNNKNFMSHAFSNVNYTVGILISLNSNLAISPSSKFSNIQKEKTAFFKLNLIFKYN